jgi:hypothetical protein
MTFATRRSYVNRGDSYIRSSRRIRLLLVYDKWTEPGVLKRSFIRGKRLSAEMTVLYVEDHADTRGVLGCFRIAAAARR